MEKKNESKTMSKKIWKWVGNVFTALFILLIVYIVLEIIIGLVNGMPPCIFGHYIFIVATNSMEPTIDVGDLVFVRKTSFSNVSINDIISFKDINPTDAVYGQYVTHRAVGGSITEGIVTQGDNPLASADAYKVTSDNFLGIVDGVSPFLGKIVSALTSSYSGLFLVLAIVMVVIIIIEVKNIVILNAQRKHENEVEKIKKEILEENKKED